MQVQKSFRYEEQKDHKANYEQFWHANASHGGDIVFNDPMQYSC
jgi:uncharacterized protein VirK/YbjX